MTTSAPRWTGGERRLIALAIAGVAGLWVTSVACQPAGLSEGGDARPATDWSTLPAVAVPEPELVPLGSRDQTYQRLCARGRGDPFAKILCGGGQRPEIRDMTELLELVGLDKDRAFAFTGNSTSLVTRSVSALNPRAIVFPRVDSDLKPPDDLIAVGFVRGEQFVELISRDPTTQDLNFYLLSFEQKCSYASGGCDLAGLLTEEIEHDWTAYSVYDQEDLEGTSFDCLSCHQPEGHGTKRILRMQELASPWLHWFPQRFAQRTDSDRVLMSLFTEMHQGEKQYGGVPLDVVSNALDDGSGAQLEALVRAEGFGQQPNPFDGQIVSEMKSGSSPTWEARFATHLNGEAIAVPYPQVDVTDEGKRTAAVRSYQDVAAGRAARGSLADIRDVFSADASEKLSFVPRLDADGRTVLLQMCARCHDGRGNPQLGKNRFNVRKLDEMPRSEKDAAIARITDPGPTRMPPWRVGSLTPENVQAATTELRK